MHASDEEWYKLVKYAIEIGLFAVSDPNKIFRNNLGEMVLAGAMAITKVKEIEGTLAHKKETIEVQRFISVMCPVNSYFRKLRGASYTLPYIGRAVLIMLENGELLVDDGADIHSCFNVFSLPDDWIGYMTFSKMVPESVVGGDPNKMVYVGIRSAPMGCSFTVDIVQSALRHCFWRLGGR